MAAFTLSTIYKAVDKMSGPLKAMEAANARFANAQSKSLTALKSSFTDVRNRLIGLAGNLSIASVLFSGFNAVKEFDSSLASLKAITGLTGKAFGPFKKEIMAVGDATKMAYPQVAKAFELIGSAKPELLDNAQAMGVMTKATILLSKASGMELEASAGALTKAMNQFGVGADQAAKFVDILSTSEQKGTATTQQIVDALVNGGSTAKTLGLSFDETNAIIQAYAKAGVLGSEAGTQMSAVLSKLATVTKKQFNPTQVGATKAIDNLAKANLKYTDLLKLVGPEKAKFLATLLNQNSVVQKLSGNLYDVGNAEKQADERNKSFTVRVEQLTAKFSNLIIKGNETSGMLNFFGKIVGFVTDHLGLLLGIIGTSIAVYASYYSIMTAIRLATVAYNVALGVFYAFQSSVPIVMKASSLTMKAYAIAQGLITAATWLYNTAMAPAITATWAFATALWATGIPEIILAVVALVASIYLLIKNWDKVSEAVINFGQAAWGWIRKAGGAVLSFLLAPLQLVLSLIAKLTGAKWAVDLSTKITNLEKNISGEDEKNKEEVIKPVNPVATANSIQTSRYEEIKRNNVNIELINKTDKQANVMTNMATIPITTKSY